MLDDWGCDHDTPGHWRALGEAGLGALRRCPACGAQAIMRRGYPEWSEPSARWKETHPKETAEAPYDRIEGDWSKPRVIPWLPWNHPNYKVTSHREAMRVCREWGIDPERGGFVSEAHRKRAEAAAARNTRTAVSKLTKQQRLARTASRNRSRRAIL